MSSDKVTTFVTVDGKAVRTWIFMNNNVIGHVKEHAPGRFFLYCDQSKTPMKSAFPTVDGAVHWITRVCPF